MVVETLYPMIIDGQKIRTGRQIDVILKAAVVESIDSAAAAVSVRPEPAPIRWTSG
jgi:hypothetical protein